MPSFVSAYHRLLGFDAFYFFYRDEVLSLPRFDELRAIPFVTLIPWNDIGTRESYYNQASGTEVECLTNYAHHYDWVFIADVDEFLWLGPDAMTQQHSVKDLLYLHRDMTYLSFGKRMYSLSHRVDMEATNYYLDTSASQPHFAVSDYPYFMDGYFCHHKGFRRGDPFCPKWRGRSKVMVRPQNHTFIDVHGTFHHPLDPSQGTIHFHPDVYHVKEFPHIFVPHNITRHPLGNSEEMDFTIHSEVEVHIHNIHTGYLPISTDPITGEETFLVRYDSNLTGWFQYVMQRATDRHGRPLRIRNYDYAHLQ
jgi:Glycosyltransferase family 92